MARRKREPEELCRFAATSFEYEVRILLCHASSFHEKYPDELLGEGLADSDDDAILEAWLVHIRLLDDFLRQGAKKEAHAADWQPKWRGDGFLSKSDRDVLNDQLFHLNWSRKRWQVGGVRPPWEGLILGWTDACCRQLLTFFDEVPEEPDDLRSAFDTPRSYVVGWLEKRARPPR